MTTMPPPRLRKASRLARCSPRMVPALAANITSTSVASSWAAVGNCRPPSTFAPRDASSGVHSFTHTSWSCRPLPAGPCVLGPPRRKTRSGDCVCAAIQADTGSARTAAAVSDANAEMTRTAIRLIRLDVLRDDVGHAILTGQHLVRLVVVYDLHLLGVPVQRPTEP